MRWPEAVCFRVTRACNARCGFCLAPNDGHHPAEGALLERIDGLVARGVRVIHFCGGEPTIHPALPALIRHVRARGARPKLTTNGLVCGGALIDALVAAGAAVKVSVHGPEAHHDAMVGRAGAHARATDTLDRLRARRIEVAVQTTIVHGAAEVAPEMVAWARARGARRWSGLPFVPRGLGAAAAGRYALTPEERGRARATVAEARRRWVGRIDVRWVDFSTRSVPVLEADGRLIVEGPHEGADRVLADDLAPHRGHAG